MFAQLFALGLTLLGAAGFSALSLFHLGTAADPLFVGAAICFAFGPLTYLTYVLFTLLIEFLHSEGVVGPRYAVISLASAQAAFPPYRSAVDVWVPEGLRRTRHGPLERSRGRAETG
jgi:hypothetical protein